MARSTTKHIALCLRSSTDPSFILRIFEQGGFVVQSFDRFADIMHAIDEASAASVPLVVLAVVQHGGLALAEALRKDAQAHTLPIALIDHEGDIRAAVRAMQLTVSDYLLPQCGEEMLQQQVDRLHDRLSATVPNSNTAVALPKSADAVINMSFDAGLRAIRKGDMWVSLSPIEWRLFEEMLNNRGRVVTFDDLVLRGLNRESVSSVETSLLRLHMSRLRAKIQQHFGRDLNIITLRGRGYMLA